MSNYFNKRMKLREAKRAFMQDIKSDRDFIEYKKRSEHHYGVLLACRAYFVLETFCNSQFFVYQGKKLSHEEETT
jgi:hypothetical protein